MSRNLQRKNELVNNLQDRVQALVAKLRRESLRNKCTEQERKDLECSINEINYYTHRIKNLAA